MNNYKITKLDGRHTGNEWFAHTVNYNFGGRHGDRWLTRSDNESLFMDHRVWCWDSLGPSCELKLFDSILHRACEHQFVQTWAWCTDDRKLKLYLTDAAMSFFMLAHSN